VATANIGGYPEQVHEVALAVEASGRIHALWTGQLNPNFERYVFYSTSTDGVNWTPYQILNYWSGYEPRVAVDDTHQRAHLLYRSNYDGIVHHTVTGGVVSPPAILDGNGTSSPDIAVNESTGYAYAVWDERYLYQLSSDSYQMRGRPRHAFWDGSGWSSHLKVINSDDVGYLSVAAAPDGGVMLAWFQRWAQSVGSAIEPDEPRVPRTAYGTSPGQYSLRQATNDIYDLPQTDDSILLAYSAGDDAFVMACDHFMWPGRSRADRYLWQDGTWSGPLDVSQNTSGWGVPVYVGAAADQPLIHYVYSDDWVLKMRTETGGVLSTPQTVADYLAGQGYNGTPAAYFVDRAGAMHMVVVGQQGGVEGFYYVRP
jgi:hypothetical protein